MTESRSGEVVSAPLSLIYPSNGTWMPVAQPSSSDIIVTQYIGNVLLGLHSLFFYIYIFYDFTLMEPSP